MPHANCSTRHRLVLHGLGLTSGRRRNGCCTANTGTTNGETHPRRTGTDAQLRSAGSCGPGQACANQFERLWPRLSESPALPTSSKDSVNSVCTTRLSSLARWKLPGSTARAHLLSPNAACLFNPRRNSVGPQAGQLAKARWDFGPGLAVVLCCGQHMSWVENDCIFHNP